MINFFNIILHQNASISSCVAISRYPLYSSFCGQLGEVFFRRNIRLYIESPQLDDLLSFIEANTGALSAKLQEYFSLRINVDPLEMNEGKVPDRLVKGIKKRWIKSIPI